MSPILQTGVPEKGTGPQWKHTQPKSGPMTVTLTLQHFIFVASYVPATSLSVFVGPEPVGQIPMMNS